MKIRAIAFSALATGALLASGCGREETGPVEISAIGSPPRLLNPNLQPLDAPSELLILATAQGLVQFDAAGQIEPALAQSWIVSDDGLRYTFRLRRTNWNGGGEATAQQVVERLRAIVSGASKNPLKPLLGSVQEIVAMTDEVLEISLVRPRPNFLQLLAQPEMAIIRDGAGTGPLHLGPEAAGALALHAPIEEELEETGETVAEEEHEAAVHLRGERAGLAVARFQQGLADLVTGGTVADLPVVRAADPGDALVFDPVAGLFGLSFAQRDGPLASPEIRRALSMAIDRTALVGGIGVPGLQPRETLLPSGIGELPQPASPDWLASDLTARRAEAARIVAAAQGEEPLTVRVALPEGSGYTLLFAYLKRDWRSIGVQAERVAMNDREADLRLMDKVAPAELASWYLRQFACNASAICDAAADEMMTAARLAPSPAERSAQLSNADRALAEITPFIPLAAPVRWSLVSPRLTGFRPNAFARHNLVELIAPRS